MLDRIIIDTNNVVSLFLGRNFSFLVDLKVIYEIELFTCDEQVSELDRVLHYAKIEKQLIYPHEWFLEFFLEVTTLVQIDLRFDRVPDIKDNYLFDLAYAVKSYYLVSGDKAVRNLKQVDQIKIISMAEFKKLLKENRK